MRGPRAETRSGKRPAKNERKAGPSMNQSRKFQRVNDQNFGAVAAIKLIFPDDGPKKSPFACFLGQSKTKNLAATRRLLLKWVQFWPRKAPFGVPEQPLGSDFVQATTSWSNWVSTTGYATSRPCAWAPLRDIYGTPGAPKRARFGPKSPFEGPGGSQAAPAGLIWSQLPPAGRATSISCALAS